MARSLRGARRPLQHPELMAENEDLEVFGSVGSTRLSSADEETDESADDEVEEGQHRPIVLGLSERESGFLTPTGTGSTVRPALGLMKNGAPKLTALVQGLRLECRRATRLAG